MNDRAVILFEGHQTKLHSHVRDVCNTFIYGINNFDHMKNEIYNVGLSSANLSKIELCKKIAEQASLLSMKWRKMLISEIILYRTKSLKKRVGRLNTRSRTEV